MTLVGCAVLSLSPPSGVAVTTIPVSSPECGGSAPIAEWVDKAADTAIATW